MKQQALPCIVQQEPSHALPGVSQLAQLSLTQQNSLHNTQLTKPIVALPKYDNVQQLSATNLCLCSKQCCLCYVFHTQMSWIATIMTIIRDNVLPCIDLCCWDGNQHTRNTQQPQMCMKEFTLWHQTFGRQLARYLQLCQMLPLLIKCASRLCSAQKEMKAT